jgi:hypothetical protein
MGLHALITFNRMYLITSLDGPLWDFVREVANLRVFIKVDTLLNERMISATTDIYYVLPFSQSQITLPLPLTLCLSQSDEVCLFAAGPHL